MNDKMLYTKDQFKALTYYTRPDNYMGATWFGYFDVAGRHRDSDVLSNSNWDCWIDFLTELLGPADQFLGEDDGEDVYNWTVCRESHWAVGWVEFIRVHETAGLDKLTQIDQQLCALADYPVFDEEHFSRMEDEERQSSWDHGCSKSWHRWLEGVVGEENYELLLKIYPDEIESLLHGAFYHDCGSGGEYWSEPAKDYTIDKLVEDASVHSTDRMNRLIENLYAAELSTSENE